MVAVLTVLCILTLSLVVVRIATVGLALTGVSRDLAQFQALSAFTGSGFTTRESEDIVNHPVRRRIAMHLMLLGNAGIVIAIASVLQFLLYSGDQDDWYETLFLRLVMLLVGIGILWLLASSQSVEKLMWKINTWALKRWAKIDVRDYQSLLRFAHDFAVSELRVHEGDWLAERVLQDLQLHAEGVLVLGIERAGSTYIGAPRGTTRIEPNDCLILYGQQATLEELDSRMTGMHGNMQHVIAVTRKLFEQEESTN